MRFLTKMLLDAAWEMIRQNRQINGFESKQEFEEAASVVDEVDGDGSLSYFTRIRPHEDFQSGNIQIVNVQHETDFERVFVPCVRGGFDEED